MVRLNVVLLCGLWTIAAAAGCRERDAGERDVGHGTDGSQRTRTRDAGERASHASDDLPLLCASCMPQSMPGGDTTDFGQTPAPTCQGHERAELHMIPIEQAEAAGFDFAEQLAAAGGHHEFSVRWTDDARLEPTVLEVDVRATGRAQLTTWIEETPDPTLSSLPLCASASDSARPEVEVQITTADRAVAGSFTGILWFSLSRSWVAPPVWDWSVAGDGSSLRGQLEFPADPPDPHVLVATIRVLHYIDGARDDRAEIGLQLLRVIPLPPWGLGYNPLIQGYGAGPLDGCSIFEVPVEPLPAGSCEKPWTQGSTCCVPALHFVRDAGIADEDAGASP